MAFFNETKAKNYTPVASLPYLGAGNFKVEFVQAKEVHGENSGNDGVVFTFKILESDNSSVKVGDEAQIGMWAHKYGLEAFQKAIMQLFALKVEHIRDVEKLKRVTEENLLEGRVAVIKGRDKPTKDGKGMYTVFNYGKIEGV